MMGGGQKEGEDPGAPTSPLSGRPGPPEQERSHV